MRPHPSGARPWASALVGRDPGVLAWCVDGLPPGLAEPWRGLWSLGSQPLHCTPSSRATRNGRVGRNLRRRVKARPDPERLSEARGLPLSLSVEPPLLAMAMVLPGARLRPAGVCGRLFWEVGREELARAWLCLRTVTVLGAFSLEGGLSIELQCPCFSSCPGERRWPDTESRGFK